MKNEYSHPKWRTKRIEVLRQLGNKCDVCGARRNLDVHHKSYSEGKELWEYPLSNFRILCKEHHNEAHGKTLEPKFCAADSCNQQIETQFTYCFEHYQEHLKSKFSADPEKIKEVLNKYGNDPEKVKEVLNKHQKDLKKLLTEKTSEAADQRKNLELEIQILNNELSNLTGSIQNIKIKNNSENEKKNNPVALILFSVVVLAIAGIWMTQNNTNQPVKNITTNQAPTANETSATSQASTTKTLSDKYSGHMACAKKCDGKLFLKRGSKGLFYGCNNFPKCKETIDHPFLCAHCKSPMDLIPSKFNNPFWGCSDFGNCKKKYRIYYKK